MTSVTELEAEAAATRTRLNATIERIQDKLTVSGMVDEVMGQVGVPRFASSQDALLGVLRRHPLPLMIAAAGIGFLIYRMNKHDAVRRTLSDGLTARSDVEALNDGHARIYDPDLPTRHPVSEMANRQRFEA